MSYASGPQQKTDNHPYLKPTYSTGGGGAGFAGNVTPPPAPIFKMKATKKRRMAGG